MQNSILKAVILVAIKGLFCSVSKLGSNFVCRFGSSFEMSTDLDPILKAVLYLILSQ